ncbi:MAG: DUF3524 domain-containing protein [Desulfobulbaceae bacterium]|nr:DUF3524 domain-containing protein [Desulfobulbaceae bacterium]
MKILILEPYYGGSHKAFIEALRLNLPFDFDLLTLPACKWKWRMRLSAPYFAEKLHENGEYEYDSILCSTFVDVATFRALAPSWVCNVPVLTYFHENQFAYPVQSEDERDFHFALTNYTTALASDRIAFNSRYNLDSFLDGVSGILKKSSDMKLVDQDKAIRAKSMVLYPGMDFLEIDEEKEKQGEDLPVIVWNHRWEHDKNPEAFFHALFEMDRHGEEFGLIVLGQSFSREPSVFEEARQRLDHRIIHFGYAESKREYVKWLKRGDIAVSTASHEFYGMAVIEAVRAGCRPLLPARLSYPELFTSDFLYDDTELASRLISELKKGRLSSKEAISMTEKFSWARLTEKYEEWFMGR